LAALSAVKVALLVVLRKHLFEIQWRFGGSEFAWGDYIAFAVFVCLGVASLIELGRHCQSVGTRAVRAANASVIGLGLVFIFLTFHEADKNYLYPVMTGILRLGDLWPYLSLDSFFRPPFLAGWLLGYALVYYGLARTGRESWVIYLTGLCAGGYGLTCLRGLAERREELVIADCIGLVCVATGWRSPWRGAGEGQPSAGEKRVPVRWLALPLGWTLAFAAGMLYLSPVRWGTSLAYFLLLLGTSLALFGGATLLAWGRAYLGAWSTQVLFYFAAFLLLANGNYPVADNFNRTLCLAFEFPHYFGGELVLVTALTLGAAFWLRLWPRAGFLWLDVVNLLLIALAFVDLRLTQILGVRLEWGVLVMGNQPKMMWRMARPYLPGALTGIGLVVLIYVLGLRATQLFQQRLRTKAGETGRINGFGYAAAMAVLLGVVGLIMARPDKAEGQTGLRLVQTSPIWKQIARRKLNQQEFLATARALGLGDFAQVRAAPSRARRDLNVVLVLMESTHNEHLSLFGSSDDTEPQLTKYKDRMELFPNFFSNFACSIHARFAAFTSLYPIEDFNAFTFERVNVKSVFEAMHEAGYTCSMFYSSYFDYTGFRDFLSRRELDEMYDADTMPGIRTTERVSWGLREEETLRAIRRQLKGYASGSRRFFLTYVPAAPHYPYEKVPEAFHKFKAGALGDYTPFYLNDLLYMDWVLTSIIDELEESGLLDKTLVVITDDHGELLGANGGPIGHGWLLSPELVNAPLIIMDPEKPGYRVNETVGSQVDLLPTLLDRLGIPLPAGQLYEGASLDAPQRPAGRLAYLNSFQQYGVLAGNHLILGDRQKDSAHLADCGRVAYTISDQGAKPLFSQGQASPPPIAIRRFDEFQESLLRNYSAYCRSGLGQ